MSATRIASLLIFSAILIPASLAAQDATGSIRGTVLDSTGSRIAQASIAVVNSSTGTRYTATSDAEGGFALELLPAGRLLRPGCRRGNVPSGHAPTARRHWRRREP